MTEHYRLSHAGESYGVHYDKAYSPQAFYGQLWNKIERPLLIQALTQLRGEGATSCLDFACGTGRILEAATQVFDDVAGVDVSETMVSQAQAKGLYADISIADITRTDLGRTFDVATSFRFFRNAEPDLRDEALAALRHHLAPGGALVINTHGNPVAPSMVALKAASILTSRRASTLSSSELIDLVEQHGFTVESTQNYSMLPRLGRFHPSWYASLMQPTERIGNKIPPLGKLCESTLIVARRTD